jgi:hypothetical protein
VEGGSCTNGIGDRVGPGDGVDDLEKREGLWIMRVYVLVNLYTVSHVAEAKKINFTL